MKNGCKEIFTFKVLFGLLGLFASLLAIFRFFLGKDLDGIILPETKAFILGMLLNYIIFVLLKFFIEKILSIKITIKRGKKYEE